MQYVSAKKVILKIARDLNLQGAIPWQDIIEWIGEGLQHIGAYGQYIEKCESLEVEGYRAKLPCDFYRVRPNPQHRFTIKGDNIIVGFKDGYFDDFSYLAFPIDEEGFPLVPDHVSYLTALFWKVAMQLSIRGELPNKELKYEVCVSRWNWYCRQAGAVGQPMDAQAKARFAAFFTSAIPIRTNYNEAYNEVNGDIIPEENPPAKSHIPQQWVPKPATPDPYVEP